MDLALIFFSATKNTALIGKTIKQTLIKLNVNIDEFDITNYEIRQKEFDFGKYDGIILGAPVYAWRAPEIVREWIKTLEGKGTLCATFFTYGGVASGATHIDTFSLLKEQNFKVVASAEFLGKHTFSNVDWELMKDRPNQEDLEISEKFAEKVIQKFSKAQPAILELPDSLPERKLNRMTKTARRAIPPPGRNGSECSLCNTCEEVCPTHAMNAEKGEANPELCIRCLRCYIHCPDEALKMPSLLKQFQVIKTMNDLTEEVLENRRSKIFI